MTKRIGLSVFNEVYNENKVCKNDGDSNEIGVMIEGADNNNSNGDYLNIGQDILDSKIRNKELKNWLSFI